MTTYENAAESAQAPASRRTYRWLALGAVGGPVLFTVAWLALGFVSPGYTAWGVHIAPYSPISQSKSSAPATAASSNAPTFTSSRRSSMAHLNPRNRLS